MYRLARHLAPALITVAITTLALAPTAIHSQEFPPPDQLKPHRGLPDPLVFFDGRNVETKDQWEKERRPELKKLFQHYMYGKLPPVPVRTTTKTISSKDCLDGKATLRQVAISFDEPKLQHGIRLLLITPKNAKSPSPVFIGMNFCGNHAVLDDPSIEIPSSWVYKSCVGVENDHATEKGRGSQKDVWNADLIIERGYALATFYSGDIDPDTSDFADGLNAEQYDLSKPLPGDAAGTIACWAWGYHRVVDYVLTDKNLDAERIIVVGHSRNGKTSLLAAALDERIALAIPHQAGCGGTAPSRTSDTRAESVQRINTSFPHWFCDNFTLFNEQTDRLPFDQHCLAALCAPRPVLFTNAEEDVWANPSGQFDMLRGATPVYELLGVEGLKADRQPPHNELVASRLGYFIRPGKHSMTRQDWEVFLDFADKQLGAPAR
jgi:(4-O-methyl)-D-glucuronate---lignin esterase